MNYVKHLNLFGVDAKEIPCIVREGTPTEETEGDVGCLYMDNDTGDIYKCVSADHGLYTWVGVIPSMIGYTKAIPTITLKVEADILPSAAMTLGAGWSGNLSDGFIHTKGNAEPLVFEINAVDGDCFFIEGEVNNTYASTIGLKCGDSYASDPYSGTTHIAWGIKCVGGGSFSVVPVSNLDFTLSSLTCKKISENGTEEITVTINGIGTDVPPSQLSGFWNLNLGIESLGEMVNGTRNIALGAHSLEDLQCGGRNIGLGTYALAHMLYGENNIAIGADSNFMSEENHNSISIGKGSMGTSKKNVDSIAIGYMALAGIANGESEKCIAIGREAAYNGGGKSSVNIGNNAGYNATGVLNVFIGNSAGQTATDGWGNVVIGANADSKTFSKCIVIGRSAVPTKHSQAVIGSAEIVETKLHGDLVVRGTDGIIRKIIFNTDGTCSWIAV